MTYKRIKNLREDHDYTQQQMAEMLHISRSAYSAYEVGSTPCPASTLVRLAGIYETSVDYLLDATDDPTPPKRK